MKNFFKYCLMTVIGLFGLWCIQPYAQLLFGLACLWIVFEIFKSTLPDEGHDWKFEYLKKRISKLEDKWFYAELKKYTRMV
tara:strand:+ start:1793 stop:2035 length:243 start_codon:yes stop_codon:yes gene_type:complete